MKRVSLFFLTLVVLLSCEEPVSPSECPALIDSADKSLFVLHIKDSVVNRVALSRFVPFQGGKVQQYFTGNDFSEDKKLMFQIPEHDSCQLKYLYFEYLNRGRMMAKY